MELWQSLTPLILDWYSRHARVLPWRSDPTPYHVWISEIMLQQTRVSAAIPYYERFLRALPDIPSLAACDDERLMKLWEGLGYYSRARNLKKAAVKIMEEFGGVFPSDPASIRSLPGIGEYTAGAISSIALGLPEPAVDGNVLRVVSRVTGNFADITKDETKQAFRALLRSAMPEQETSAYTQALMELGATVCLPNGAPLCSDCPVSCSCVAFQQNLISVLPVKTSPKTRRVEERTVFFCFSDRRVALRRRPQKGLLSGLWEFPNEPAGNLPDVPNLSLLETGSFGQGKHVFSHVEWRMQSAIAELPEDGLPEGWVWATAEELKSVYAIPAAFRSFLPQVLSRLE